MQINEEELVDDIKRFVSENVSLSKISDEELAERIDQIVTDRLKDIYCPIETKVSISQQVYSSIRGFGLLDSIISDDSITEVMINGPEKIFIEKKGRLTRLDKKFESQRKLEDVIQRIVGLAGREVNQANPICDTRLPDGSRVNVVLPPIALCGPTITIRKFSKEPMTINKLIEYGSITQEIADKLELLVKAKYNIFISGGTGSGKTTFLNALSNFIPKDERIITIEDSAELQITGIDNLVSLETRNANASGAGQVTIRDLIKSSLRMRPERIIVGECRGGEALDMLQAMKCADPMLDDIESGSIPDFNSVSLKPYRYLTGSLRDTEGDIESEINKNVGKIGTGFFTGMKPSISIDRLKFESKVIYSKVNVDVSYKIKMPIRLLGQDEFTNISYATHTDVPVSDVPEFIRTVDFAEDLVQRYTNHDISEPAGKLADKITEWTSK